MTEYISLKAAIDVIMSEPTDAHYPSWYADKIESISVADVVPVRHGRWIENTDGIYCWFECSECGGAAPRDIDSEIVLSAYCPNCGAKMDLRVTDNG